MTAQTRYSQTALTFTRSRLNSVWNVWVLSQLAVTSTNCSWKRHLIESADTAAASRAQMKDRGLSALSSWEHIDGIHIHSLLPPSLPPSLLLPAYFSLPPSLPASLTPLPSASLFLIIASLSLYLSSHFLTLYLNHLYHSVSFHLLNLPLVLPARRSPPLSHRRVVTLDLSDIFLIINGGLESVLPIGPDIITLTMSLTFTRRLTAAAEHTDHIFKLSAS